MPTDLVSDINGKDGHVEGKRKKAKTVSFSFLLKNQQITSLNAN
jgi:hypothetical protein